MKDDMGIPRVDLSLCLGASKAALTSHLMHYHEDIQRMVEHAIEAEIKNFDLSKSVEREIKKSIEDVLEYSVRHFFQFGNGRVVLLQAMKEWLEGEIKKDEK